MRCEPQRHVARDVVAFIHGLRFADLPEEVVAHLEANGVAIEEGPTRKQGARGTLLSVYCRDPDGSLIEISSYEK